MNQNTPQDAQKCPANAQQQPQPSQEVGDSIERSMRGIAANLRLNLSEPPPERKPPPPQPAKPADLDWPEF